MRNPEQTRLKLMATATQLLLANGPEGLRVDEVASAAAVNKRMIYHYFKNKDGLYQRVLQHQVNLLVEHAEVLSMGAKVFLLEHFLLSANKSDDLASGTEAPSLKEGWQKARKEALLEEGNARGEKLPKADDLQQCLQDAGLIVLRALLTPQRFATRLSRQDWVSLAQGLMDLGLPHLAVAGAAALPIENKSERPLTVKPRYTLKAKLRYRD